MISEDTDSVSVEYHTSKAKGKGKTPMFDFARFNDLATKSTNEQQVTHEPRSNESDYAAGKGFGTPVHSKEQGDRTSSSAQKLRGMLYDSPGLIERRLGQMGRVRPVSDIFASRVVNPSGVVSGTGLKLNDSASHLLPGRASGKVSENLGPSMEQSKQSIGFGSLGRSMSDPGDNPAKRRTNQLQDSEVCLTCGQTLLSSQFNMDLISHGNNNKKNKSGSIGSEQEPSDSELLELDAMRQEGYEASQDRDQERGGMDMGGCRGDGTRKRGRRRARKRTHRKPVQRKRKRTRRKAARNNIKRTRTRRRAARNKNKRM